MNQTALSPMMPLVSIGLPVYNGEHSLAAALDSLVCQDYQNIEIILSDNCSSDRTQEICENYAKRDARIVYVRQEKNKGAAFNFEYVLQRSTGQYFMWAAADDYRTTDFINENVAFLEANPHYVASTCPNCFERQDISVYELVDFSIEGDLAERINVFLDCCWKSHGIFYSVMRADVIKKCGFLRDFFMGLDWAIDLYLIKHGPINRVKSGRLVSGIGGVSNGPNRWKLFRTRSISWIFPFYRVSLYTLSICSELPFSQQLKIAIKLMRLNKNAARDQFVFEFGPSYRKLKNSYCGFGRHCK